MIVRLSTYQECKPLLKKHIWTDSFHLSNFDNSVGLVSWSPSEYSKINLAFYVIEHDDKLVGTVHAFNASPELICLRGLWFAPGVGSSGIVDLIDQAVDAVRQGNEAYAYLVHKENLIPKTNELGFVKTQGPLWTNDWKVFVSWKKLDTGS
jgi:N-acetylglutamate synthase-like GNAT family acetyltransferase